MEALRGQDPELLYQKDCEHKGRIEDRCQLYVLRCAVYYADQTAQGKTPDPQKCRWWYWKEHVYPSSDDTESLFPLLKSTRTPLFGGWLRPSDPGSLLYSERDFAPLRSPM